MNTFCVHDISAWFISTGKLKSADYYILTETTTVSSFGVTVTTGNVLIRAELNILNLYILCVRKQLLAVNSLQWNMNGLNSKVREFFYKKLS